jgi:hypothetical protein
VIDQNIIDEEIENSFDFEGMKFDTLPVEIKAIEKDFFTQYIKMRVKI